MKKDFDFDDIGKQTPYRTPEGFFGDVQRKVMERSGVSRQRKSRLKLIVSTAITIAAILTGLLFVPSLYRMDTTPTPSTSGTLAIEKTTSDPMDRWINELSDEELAELVNFSDNDMFLN